MQTTEPSLPVSSPAIPVFVDCDNTLGRPRSEIDDGLALLYLLDQPNLFICGVSTTFGNASTDVTTRLTRDLASALGDPFEVHPGGPGDSPAVRALVAASIEHAGRLVVLGLGALTNIAHAGRMDPVFYDRLAAISVMGGYLAPLRFARREVAELNFSSDPQAAHEVLNAPCPITVMSAQLCLRARFGLRHLVLYNRGPRRLRRLVREWFTSFSLWAGSAGFYLWDLVPAVAVAEPWRFPAVSYRISSSPADLRTGRLRLDGPTDPSDVDPCTPGIVSVPDQMLRPARFARECASAWVHAVGVRAVSSLP